MISIIVPVYNVEAYLPCCIDSIINQTYKDLEILIIDDGSTDSSGKICDEYKARDNRIKVFHTDNYGLSAARNLGIRKAGGDYLGFVDSDDWIEPDMYEVLMKRALEYNLDVCECNFWFGEKEEDYTNLIDAVYTNIESLKALFEDRICHVVWNKIYKKELFDEVCFPEGRNIEDISVMHLLLERASSVMVISEKKYHYRQRADSIKNTYSASNLIDYADAFLDRYEYYIRNQAKLRDLDEEKQLLSVALGISRVWRWWYKCSKGERQAYSGKIQELKNFSRRHFSLLGNPSWPVYLRCICIFLYSDKIVSFMILYYLNQIYRRVKPEKSNITR